MISRVSDDDVNLRVAWRQAQAALDSQPGAHAIYHYETGEQGHKKPLSRTVGAQAERVDGGRPTESIQESCSFVYHCYDGSGRTELQLADGSTTQLEWKKGDTFAVPAWSKRFHISSTDRSYLFAVNDRPLLENLGMYRKA